MKQLTPEILQHRIDHYTAVAVAESEAYIEQLKEHSLSLFYRGKADAYKNLLKELYPNIGSDRVYPLDLVEFSKEVEQIKSIYKK